MIYLASFLLAAVAVGLDQFTKYLTVANLALGEDFPVWPGMFHFTHLRNDGMSFSLLSGARWFFVIVTIVVILFALYAIYRRWIDHPMGILSLAAVLGGAVGNLIDRIRFGYVVDMIEVEFVRFAVFNVADMFVVVGGIVFMLYGLLFWKEPERPSKEDTNDPES